MDGVHDVGGLHGFGPVVARVDEPVFGAEWERRCFGLVVSVAVAGLTGPSFTRMRAAIEAMAPDHYLSSPYYEHWLTAVASILVQAGLVDADELAERAGGAFPLASPPLPDPLAGGVPTAPTTTRFALGDRVRVRDLSPAGHTRCPRYVRRRVGVVARLHDHMVLPDLEAASGERLTEPVYGISFTAAELWGRGEGLVNVDLWDRYLEAT